MRKRARTDDNHSEIAHVFRQLGCTVVSLAPLGNGCGDLLVGVSGINLLVEVKDGSQPPSRRRLTRDEKAFHELWSGQICVIESLTDAVDLVRAAREQRNRMNWEREGQDGTAHETMRQDLDPNTGIKPIRDWGPECGRGFVRDSRFGGGQVISGTNRQKTRQNRRLVDWRSAR